MKHKSARMNIIGGFATVHESNKSSSEVKKGLDDVVRIPIGGFATVICKKGDRISGAGGADNPLKINRM